MTIEPTDSATIVGLIEDWAKSVRDKNIEGVLAHHAPDVLIYDVVAPIRSKGIAEYRKSWVELFFPWAGENGKFDLNDVSVVSGDTVAFATALIECAGKEKGKSVEFTVRLTIGFEKRDGRWAFVHEHHSEPVRYER